MFFYCVIINLENMKNNYLVLAIVAISVVAIAGLGFKLFGDRNELRVNVDSETLSENKTQAKEKIC